jgi:glycosyltransferase involved in cell wall biosynthesis
MSSDPMVSVTIPVLNGEKYLDQAIESVLAQTCDSWELLIVDDGSTDRSREIAERFARDWSGKIIVLDHPGRENRGMMASRNLGLSRSRGQYIARLDADDVLQPTAFEDQVAVMVAHPSVAMTYGPVEIWLSWSSLESRADTLQPLSVPRNTPVMPPQVLAAFLADDRDEPVGMFVRRSVMDDIGGYATAGLYRELYEDVALNVKICLKYPVFVSGQCWYRYRQHADSYCSVAQKRNDYNTGCMRFYEWVANYFIANEVKDPELWNALGNAGSGGARSKRPG